MLLPNTRNLVIIGAFVAVCGLAVAGWMRKTDHPAENSLVGSQFVPEGTNNTAVPVNSSTYPSSSGYAAPSAYSSPEGTPYPAQGPVPQPTAYGSDGYYSSRTRPVYIRRGEAVQEPLAQPEPAAPARVYHEQEYYSDARPRHRGRSKTHSVEIVAGTAAAGAGIGALAGGGKGAAIGALSGGGAGFIYDRLTHNH